MGQDEERKLEEVARLSKKLNEKVDAANQKIAEFTAKMREANVAVHARTGRLSYERINGQWEVAFNVRDVCGDIIKLSAASRQIRIEYADKLPELLDAILERLRVMNEQNEQRQNNEER